MLSGCLCVCWGHLIAFMLQIFPPYVAHIQNPDCFVEVGDSPTVVRGSADKGVSLVFGMFLKSDDVRG